MTYCTQKHLLLVFKIEQVLPTRGRWLRCLGGDSAFLVNASAVHICHPERSEGSGFLRTRSICEDYNPEPRLQYPNNLVLRSSHGSNIRSRLDYVI
jgi:hypothetical protein